MPVWFFVGLLLLLHGILILASGLVATKAVAALADVRLAVMVEDDLEDGVAR